MTAGSFLAPGPCLQCSPGHWPHPLRWHLSRAAASHHIPLSLGAISRSSVSHHRALVGPISGTKPAPAARTSAGTGPLRRCSGPRGIPSHSCAQNPADPVADQPRSVLGTPASPLRGDVRAARAAALAGAAATADGLAATATSGLDMGLTAAAAAAAAAGADAPVPDTGTGGPEFALLSRRRLVRAAAAGLLALLAPAMPHPGEAGASASPVVAADLSSGAGNDVFAYVAPEPLDGTGPAAVLPPAPRHFSSLAAAVAACPAGGVVLVAAGRYRERLLLSRPVTLRAWPPGARVEVVWETAQPYESTLEISAPPLPEEGTAGPAQVVVEGLTIRHSSKSVANNYGVYIRAGSPRLVDCDISSATGAGVGGEGASPQLLGCRIHDCARQGIAIFGASLLDLDPDLASVVEPGLMYGMSGGTVQGCDVYGNALDGVLVRSGASPDLLDNLIHNNGGVGVNLQDASGRYERNTVYDNARGAVAISALFELDAGDLAGSNNLKGLVRRL